MNDNCPKHNARSYSVEYDAWYCYLCNVWLEKKCKDPNCGMCPRRPRKPVGLFQFIFGDVPENYY